MYRTVLTLILLAGLGAPCAAQSQYTESVLYSFTSAADGSYPVGGLIVDAKGTLYGTTQYGGSLTGPCAQGGCGTVFKLSPTGVKTTLHTFTAGTDGALPNASLAMDKSGSLYGTTVFGGVGYGIVFKLTAAGRYSILHTFGKAAGDGRYPLGPPTLDSAGNLYGTASDLNVCDAECPTVKDGGYGVVWKLSAKGAVETILYAFGVDGNPVANLIRDGQGNLYGGAFAGGTASGGTFYGGALFKLPAKGAESTIYAFCADAGCADGQDPSYVARDSRGNFYAEVAGAGSAMQGAIAVVTAQGMESMLWQFCSLAGCVDGQSPSGPLAVIGGSLYGATQGGGASGEGTVYELTPSGALTTLYSFAPGGDAAQPMGGVVADAAGNLYGTSSAGGANGMGAVWKLTAAGK
jgi:uncharacterized repeat protein (TIGR03803 family)